MVEIGGGDYYTITSGPVHSVTVGAVVQHLQCNKCCTRVMKDLAEEKRACLLAASSVYQLIP